MNVIFAVRACGNACAPLFFCPAALKVRRLVEGKATKVRRLVEGVTLKVRRLLNLGESLQAVNVNVAQSGGPAGGAPKSQRGAPKSQ